MNAFFSFLTTIAFLALIVGLIKPSWVRMPSRKRVGMIYGGAWLVFFILFGITSRRANTTPGQSTTPSTTAHTAATQTQAAPSQPAAPLTDQQKLDSTVSGQMSSNPATGLQASYVSSQIQPDDYADDGVTRPAGSHYILVTINVPGIEWSNNLFIEDTGQLSSEIFQQVFPLDPNFYDVAVWYMGPITDAYGNTTTTDLITYTMDRPLYNKIDWSNFSSTQNDVHLCDFLRAQYASLTTDEQANSDVGCTIAASNLQQAEASIQASNPE
jgi:hypothetical protein